jgi:hypothetical protein
MHVPSNPIATGIYTRQDSDLPRDIIFNSLYELWAKAEPNRNKARFAEALGVSTQVVANWSARGAPWWVICVLERELNLRVAIESNRIYLEKVPARRTPKNTNGKKTKTAPRGTKTQARMRPAA